MLQPFDRRHRILVDLVATEIWGWGGRIEDLSCVTLIRAKGKFHQLYTVRLA